MNIDASSKRRELSSELHPTPLVLIHNMHITSKSSFYRFLLKQETISSYRKLMLGNVISDKYSPKECSTEYRFHRMLKKKSPKKVFYCQLCLGNDASTKLKRIFQEHFPDLALLSRNVFYNWHSADVS